jgi:hypothetical protein
VARNTGEAEERVTFPWPETARPPWQVTVTWRFTDEDAMPIAVEARSNHGPVTATAWQGIRVQEVIALSRQRLSRELRLDDYVQISDEMKVSFPVGSRPHGRPRHHDDAFLREVAEAYMKAEAYHSRRPVREVAEHFTRKGVPDAAVAAKGWVGEARRRGFIVTGGGATT